MKTDFGTISKEQARRVVGQFHDAYGGLITMWSGEPPTVTKRYRFGEHKPKGQPREYLLWYDGVYLGAFPTKKARREALQLTLELGREP